MCNNGAPCRESESLREELRAVEWDIGSLDRELESAEERARRLRRELKTHSCGFEAGS